MVMIALLSLGASLIGLAQLIAISRERTAVLIIGIALCVVAMIWALIFLNGGATCGG